MDGKLLVKVLVLYISSCWGIDSWSYNTTGDSMVTGNRTLIIAGYPSMECQPDKEATFMVLPTLTGCGIFALLITVWKMYTRINARNATPNCVDHQPTNSV